MIARSREQKPDLLVIFSVSIDKRIQLFLWIDKSQNSKIPAGKITNFQNSDLLPRPNHL